MFNPSFSNESPPKPPDQSLGSEEEGVRIAKKGRHDGEGGQTGYKDCLMEGIATETTMEDVVSSMKVVVEMNDIQVMKQGHEIHVITSAGLRERLAMNFRYAVIVNLLGRSIGYKALCTKLRGVWNLNCAKVLDMGNQFFLVQFATEAAYLQSLLEGPWTIMGSYLQVQPWSTSFRVHHQSPRKATVWCSLPELPLHYYPPDVIQAIGEAIGTVIRIDDNTSELQRGRFARLAVSIDLDQPLVSKFVLDGVVQKVEYENMEEVCVYCCRYGHRESYCQWKPKEGDAAKDSTTNTAEKTASNENFSHGLWLRRGNELLGVLRIIKKIRIHRRGLVLIQSVMKMRVLR